MNLDELCKTHRSKQYKISWDKGKDRETAAEPYRAQISVADMAVGGAWTTFGPVITLWPHRERETAASCLSPKSCCADVNKGTSTSTPLYARSTHPTRPTALINGVVAVFVFAYVNPGLPTLEDNNILPTLAQCLTHLLFCELIGDFFLYWGHRVQHESEYLWKNFHSYHHQLGVPNPVGALYIDSMDVSRRAERPSSSTLKLSLNLTITLADLFLSCVCYFCEDLFSADPAYI